MTNFTGPSIGVPGGNSMIMSGNLPYGGTYGSGGSLLGGMTGYGTGGYGTPGVMGMPGMNPMGGSMMPMQSNQPPVNSWLLRTIGGPSFSPPAPAEAAASWSNHASVAAQNALHTYMDIEKIKTDAMHQIENLNTKANLELAQVKQARDDFFNTMDLETRQLWKHYADTQIAVDKMFKEASHYAHKAYGLAQDANEAMREGKFSKDLDSLSSSSKEGISEVSASSLCERKESSVVDSHLPHESDRVISSFDPIFRRHHHHHRSPEEKDLQEVMMLIEDEFKRLKKLGYIPQNAHFPKEMKAIAGRSQSDSALDSKDKLEQDISDRATKSASVLKHTPKKAVELEHVAKLAKIALLHDTVLAINSQLKSVNALASKMSLKELDAEKQIHTAVMNVQKTVMQAGDIANRASIIARTALNNINHLQREAEYAQNAAGQALAAQMGQAMGFPIAAKGSPSPFPPPSAYPFSIPQSDLPGTVYSEGFDGEAVVLMSTMRFSVVHERCRGPLIDFL